MVKHANLIIVAGEKRPQQRAKKGRVADGAGNRKRRRLLPVAATSKRIGMKASDTSELFFDNVGHPALKSAGWR